MNKAQLFTSRNPFVAVFSPEGDERQRFPSTHIHLKISSLVCDQSIPFTVKLRNLGNYFPSLVTQVLNTFGDLPEKDVSYCIFVFPAPILGITSMEESSA